MLRNNIAISDKVRMYMTQAFQDGQPPTTTSDCATQLRSARQEVKRLVQISFAKREEEQRQRIATLEASTSKTDKDHAKIIRRIIRAASLKRLFKKITAARAARCHTNRDSSTSRRRSKSLYRMAIDWCTIQNHRSTPKSKSTTFWSSCGYSLYYSTTGKLLRFYRRGHHQRFVVERRTQTIEQVIGQH